MHSKSEAIFFVAVAGLLGATAVQAETIVFAYFAGSVPQADVFTVFFWIWVTAAIVLLVAGFRGAYMALRTGNLKQPLLAMYLVSSCFMFQIADYNLGWSAVNVTFFFGWKPVALGINVLGVATYSWFLGLQHAREGVRGSDTSAA